MPLEVKGIHWVGLVCCTFPWVGVYMYSVCSITSHFPRSLLYVVYAMGAPTEVLAAWCLILSRGEHQVFAIYSSEVPRDNTRQRQFDAHGCAGTASLNQKGSKKVSHIAPLVDPRTEIGSSEDVGQASVEAPRKTPPQFLSATCIMAIAPKLTFPQQSAPSPNVQPGKYRAGMARSRRLVVASLCLDWVHYSPRPCCGCYGSRSIVSL
jgi:hypothetical protein